jgi:hypothetical protein
MGLMVLGMYEVFLSETRALALPNEVELDTPFDFYCGTGVDQKDLQIAIRHNGTLKYRQIVLNKKWCGSPRRLRRGYKVKTFLT